MTAARKSLARTSLVLFKDWMVSNSPMQFFRPIIRDGASKSKFFSRIAHPARGHAKGATRRREHNQCIHCSVHSCKHHGAQDMCSLESITVRAKAGCQSGCKDESMCGNYECIK